MASVIGVKGINKLAEGLVEHGIDGLKQFTTAAKEDRVTSDFHYVGEHVVEGDYALDKDGNVGFALSTPSLPANTLPVNVGVDGGMTWHNDGKAHARLTLRFELTARDERVVELMAAQATGKPAGERGGGLGR